MRDGNNETGDGIDVIAQKATDEIREYFGKPFYAKNVIEDEVLHIVRNAILESK